jgi:2-polyprenyl-3-methyl-5-hydroxy-6-metoxy-1,4-benzoquinol methylase
MIQEQRPDFTFDVEKSRIATLRFIHQEKYTGMGREIRAWALKELKPNKVLDAGCGSGWISVQLAKNGYSVVSIDLSKKNVKCVKELAKAEKVELSPIRASFTHLPIKSGYFDSMVSLHVVEHIKQIELAFLELKRTLIPGGKLCIVTPNGYGLVSIIQDFLLTNLHIIKPVGHVQKYTPDIIMNLFSSANFKILNFRNSEILTSIYVVISAAIGRDKSFIQLEIIDHKMSKQLPLHLGSVWMITAQT